MCLGFIIMEYHIVKIDGVELKLYKTISDTRQPEETQQEYKMRRHFVKQQIKDRKRFGLDFKYKQ